MNRPRLFDDWWVWTCPNVGHGRSPWQLVDRTFTGAVLLGRKHLTTCQGRAPLTLKSHACKVVLMTDIHCEDCDRLDHPRVTQDEAREHERKTDHEVVIHIR